MGCRAVTLDHTGEGVTHVASPPSREDLENALTEAKRVDADLRRIINTIPVLAWCNLPDGSNEFHNQRWYDYTGLSPQEASGWGWRAAFQPDDLDPLMETWTALQSSGEAGEIEARMRRYDGEYRWFLLRFEPLRDELGNIVRWYGTNTDIDDLKRAQVALRQDQEELRRITDAIPQAIIVLSPEGRPLYTNRAALEYTGLSLEEVRAEDYRARIFHPRTSRGCAKHGRAHCRGLFRSATNNAPSEKTAGTAGFSSVTTRYWTRTEESFAGMQREPTSMIASAAKTDCETRLSRCVKTSCVLPCSTRSSAHPRCCVGCCRRSRKCPLLIPRS